MAVSQDRVSSGYILILQLCCIAVLAFSIVRKTYSLFRHYTGCEISKCRKKWSELTKSKEAEEVTGNEEGDTKQETEGNVAVSVKTEDEWSTSVAHDNNWFRDDSLTGSVTRDPNKKRRELLKKKEKRLKKFKEVNLAKTGTAKSPSKKTKKGKKKSKSSQQQKSTIASKAPKKKPAEIVDEVDIAVETPDPRAMSKMEELRKKMEESVKKDREELEHINPAQSCFSRIKYRLRSLCSCSCLSTDSFCSLSLVYLWLEFRSLFIVSPNRILISSRATLGFIGYYLQPLLWLLLLSDVFIAKSDAYSQCSLAGFILKLTTLMGLLCADVCHAAVFWHNFEFMRTARKWRATIAFGYLFYFSLLIIYGFVFIHSAFEWKEIGHTGKYVCYLSHTSHLLVLFLLPALVSTILRVTLAALLAWTCSDLIRKEEERIVTAFSMLSTFERMISKKKMHPSELQVKFLKVSLVHMLVLLCSATTLVFIFLLPLSVFPSLPVLSMITFAVECLTIDCLFHDGFKKSSKMIKCLLQKAQRKYRNKFSELAERVKEEEEAEGGGVRLSAVSRGADPDHPLARFSLPGAELFSKLADQLLQFEPSVSHTDSAELQLRIRMNR